MPSAGSGQPQPGQIAPGRGPAGSSGSARQARRCGPPGRIAVMIRVATARPVGGAPGSRAGDARRRRPAAALAVPPAVPERRAVVPAGQLRQARGHGHEHAQTISAPSAAPRIDADAGHAEPDAVPHQRGSSGRCRGRARPAGRGRVMPVGRCRRLVRAVIMASALLPHGAGAAGGSRARRASRDAIVLLAARWRSAASAATRMLVDVPRREDLSVRSSGDCRSAECDTMAVPELHAERWQDQVGHMACRRIRRSTGSTGIEDRQRYQAGHVRAPASTGPGRRRSGT